MQDIFFSIYFKLHAICFKVNTNRIFYSTTSNTDKQLNSYHPSSSLPTFTCFNFEDDFLLFFYFFFYILLPQTTFSYSLVIQKRFRATYFLIFLNSFNCFIHRRMRQLKMLLHPTLNRIKYMSNGVKSFEPSRLEH